MTASSNNKASNNQKWIVAVVDEAFSSSVVGNNQKQNRKLLKIPDPATKEERQYVFHQTLDTTSNNTDATATTRSSNIYEIQELQEDFSSFFVGRHVVKNGNLYVVNRMDPLFFVVTTKTSDMSQKQSWQPYDQTMESALPQELQSFTTILVDETQMKNVYETLCNDQTCDETYYKFSVTKTLNWLKKKQDAVYQVLVKQDALMQMAKKQSFQNMTASKGGSVSSSFNMPDVGGAKAAVPSASDNDKDSYSNVTELKIESIQIICNYLSEEWRKVFIESFDGDVIESSVLGTTSTATSNGTKNDSSANPYQTDSGMNTANSSSSSNTSSSSFKKYVDQKKQDMDRQKTAESIKKKKEVMQPRSIANKRLATISTKGMKSLGSFFGAKAPAKTPGTTEPAKKKMKIT